MATIAELAARALRKVGLTPVAISDHPSAGTTVLVGTIAARALRSLGINPRAEGAEAANSGTTTVTAVATAALRRLAVVAAEETPSSSDQAMALEKATAVHQVMAALNIAAWTSTEIPLYAGQQYEIMTAALLAPAFGLPVPDGAYAGAETNLRQIALSGAAGQALAEAEVNAAHQELNGMGLVTWGTDAIPEAVASHYAMMASVRLAPAMGKPADEAGYSAGVMLVRRLVMSGPVGQAIAEQKVASAHNSLAARGLTRWTSHDIPAYAEESYVMMAAELLAPDVGQPLMPGLWKSGENEIRRAVATPSARRSVRMVAF